MILNLDYDLMNIFYFLHLITDCVIKLENKVTERAIEITTAFADCTSKIVNIIFKYPVNRKLKKKYILNITNKQ